MKYFKNCETVQQIKNTYKKLAMKNHPDKGGNPETMKAINAEYDEALKAAIKTHNQKVKKESQKIKYDEMKESMFKEIISKLITIHKIKIEIVGMWIWVSGETFPIKEQLKDLKFRWSTTRQKWYFIGANDTGRRGSGYRSKYKKFSDIKKAYNTTEVEVERVKMVN